MDYLWTPWRYRYVSEGVRSEGCVFCRAAADPKRDREHFVLYRGELNFILLNLFPYTSGHVMVAPYPHVANLESLDAAVLKEMMMLARELERTLDCAYHPEGYNLGMNLGRSAGAGIADHLHLHVLPRWTGDTNFMTVVGETRLLPEELSATYDKLAGLFRKPVS